MTSARIELGSGSLQLRLLTKLNSFLIQMVKHLNHYTLAASSCNSKFRLIIYTFLYLQKKRVPFRTRLDL
jgi:hypothetical protein